MECRPPVIYSDSIKTIEDCLKYLDFDVAYYNPEHECYEYSVEYTARKDNCELSFLAKSDESDVKEVVPTSTEILTPTFTPTPTMSYDVTSKKTNTNESVLGNQDEQYRRKEYVEETLQLDSVSYKTMNNWIPGTSSVLILAVLVFFIIYRYFEYMEDSKRKKSVLSLIKFETSGYEKWFVIWSLIFAVYGAFFVYHHELTTLISWLVFCGVFYFLYRNK